MLLIKLINWHDQPPKMTQWRLVSMEEDEEQILIDCVLKKWNHICQEEDHE